MFFNWLCQTNQEKNDDPALKELLGGSDLEWPLQIDGRTYLSFWGGNKGGCCHNDNAFTSGNKYI